MRKEVNDRVALHDKNNTYCKVLMQLVIMRIMIVTENTDKLTGDLVVPISR